MASLAKSIRVARRSELLVHPNTLAYLCFRVHHRNDWPEAFQKRRERTTHFVNLPVATQYIPSETGLANKANLLPILILVLDLSVIGTMVQWTRISSYTIIYIFYRKLF